MAQEKMTRISATIPEPVAEQFKELCKKQRRSVSAQITLLMEQAIQGVEGDAADINPRSFKPREGK